MDGRAMIDKKLLRLMNQELDGANTADESRVLKAFLEDNEDARSRFRELGAVMDMIRGGAGPEPKPDFPKSVLAEIGRRAVAPEKPGRASVSIRGFWSRETAFGGLRLKYGLFFGLGLGLGLLLLVLFNNRAAGPGLDTRQLAGTVLNTAELHPVEETALLGDGLRQKLSLWSGDGRLAARFQGSAAKGIEIAIAFDRTELSFDSFQQTEGDRGGFDIEPGRLVVRTSGTHAFLILFKAKTGLPTSLKILVSSSGIPIAEKYLVAPKGGSR
jgi:hypothetical protein